METAKPVAVRACACAACKRHGLRLLACQPASHSPFRVPQAPHGPHARVSGAADEDEKAALITSPSAAALVRARAACRLSAHLWSRALGIRLRALRSLRPRGCASG